jgi:hypothetical protein|tara:strand:+ start:384 stop:593 length:210 start_codon:yes stop_codon:yes gene_type:complete
MNYNFPTGSSLYKEFLAERDEILKLKWIESEKKGKDIGFEVALLTWVKKHRSEWKKSRDAYISIDKNHT